MIVVSYLFYNKHNLYLYFMFVYFFYLIIIVLLLDNGDKKVSTSNNDATDGPLNVDSKSNILKKLSKFRYF